MHISIVAKRKAFMKILITEIACLKYSPEWEKLTFLCQYVTEENWNNNKILSFSVCFLAKNYKTVWRSQGSNYFQFHPLSMNCACLILCTNTILFVIWTRGSTFLSFWWFERENIVKLFFGYMVILLVNWGSQKALNIEVNNAT